MTKFDLVLTHLIGIITGILIGMHLANTYFVCN